MAVFDIFKRLVNQNTATSERRADERLRAMLGARVLVVDDSATIRAVLGKMLMQDGYEVLKAADGENAVEMAQSLFPDLIFLDIVLPGMSGFAVLRALRRDSRTHATPIIMMSGNQQATEQFYVQRFGADGFIKKPFGRAEVFHAVRSLVQAGRLTARVEVVPAGQIPDGMSADEWNAIPDVAMPDEAHLAAKPGVPERAVDPVPAAPQAGSGRAVDTAVSTGTTPIPGVTSMSTVAFSPAMRPTLVTRLHPQPPGTAPAITLHVTAPPGTAAPGVSQAAAPGKGRDDEA